MEPAAKLDSTTVSSWAELIDVLYYESWDKSIERFRSPYVFRGVGIATDDLSTTLQRLASGHKDVSKLEGHLLRNFRKYAHAGAASGHSLWNWLALAAHHGLPTRMLDWTYSPFVALHFATENLAAYNRDAVIWCLNHRAASERLPGELKIKLSEEGSNVFTVEMLSGVARTLEELQALSDHDFVVFLEPPSLDERIVNQFALFSLMSRPDRSISDWLRHNSDVARRLVIPADLKWEVRDKLDQVGITERILVPGLDGLTAWLTRYYSRRSGRPVDVHPDRSAAEKLHRD